MPVNTRVKVVAAAIASILVLIVAAILWFGMIGYNSTHEYQIYQSVTGNVQVIDNSGYYWKGFGTVWTYPRAVQAYYSQHPDEGGSKDWSVRVTFNDGGTAQISTFVKVQLPIAHDERLALHCDFNANPKNILDAVRSHLVNCVKASGPMMSASENQASRKAEFNQIVEEQLVAGLFEMRRTEVELLDTAQMETTGMTPDGKPIIREKKARVQATEIVLDKAGKPIIVQESPLARYKITILQFSVTETTYDDVTLKQFAAKKESYLAAEQAKAKRQEEYQQRLMVTEKGLRQVAEIEAQMNQEKKKATIAAEQKREVATIEKDQAVIVAVQKVEVAIKTKVEAETLREIASIKAATAELDKKATISAAEAKQKEIELGGGLAEKDRILATIKADRDAKVAAALAGVKTPSVLIIGGEANGKGANLTETLMNLLLLKATGVLPEQK